MDPYRIMPEKKSHAVLYIVIVIILIIVVTLCFYFWQIVSAPVPVTTPTSSTTPSALIQAKTILSGTTTPEQDLSSDVLNGTVIDITQGISQ